MFALGHLFLLTTSVVTVRNVRPRDERKVAFSGVRYALISGDSINWSEG